MPYTVKGFFDVEIDDDCEFLKIKSSRRPLNRARKLFCRQVTS
jgi:hypothetical protein